MKAAAGWRRILRGHGALDPLASLTRVRLVLDEQRDVDEGDGDVVEQRDDAENEQLLELEQQAALARRARWLRALRPLDRCEGGQGGAVGGIK